MVLFAGTVVVIATIGLQHTLGYVFKERDSKEVLLGAEAQHFSPIKGLLPGQVKMEKQSKGSIWRNFTVGGWVA
jgi:hypothetical protein